MPRSLSTTITAMSFGRYTPTVFVAAGTPTLVANAIWGVCQHDVAAGETAAFRIRGVFRGKKVTQASR